MYNGIYIGIDSGTQGVKVLALDAESGRVLARAAAAHALIEGAGGRREQEPHWWFTALTVALAQLLASPAVAPSRVKALAVSGQQHGFVPLDAHGKVIRPAKLWCDTETAAEAEQLTDMLGGIDRAIELTGNAIAAGFTASKVLWLKNHEPENYRRLATILLPHDYLNYRLTGALRTECGDASGTAYFDVRSREWCTEVLNTIDDSGRLTACLPALIGADEPVGTLLPAVAEELGLPRDVLVAAGGGDNMLAAIGTGNVRPGVVTASLGTSGTIYAHADAPVVDPRGELAAFCSSTGAWLPLVCTMNVTVSTETVRNMFSLDLDEFTALAAQAPPGAEGVALVPFFNGERTPALPLASAGFNGLTPSNTTPANLCRAAIEGPTLGLCYGLDVLRRCGVVPAEIRLIGGGANNALWRQIAADVFNCPVVCLVETEAGALGAAIQALWCHHRQRGVPTPIAELASRYVQLSAASRTGPSAMNCEVYTGLYRRHLRLVETMTAYWSGD